MGSKNQTTKSVCLNYNNEEDKKILKHVSRRNFSGYVKKLILDDIKTNLEKKQTTPKPKQEQLEQKINKRSPEIVQNRKVSVQSTSVQGRNLGSIGSVSPLIKIQQKNQQHPT